MKQEEKLDELLKTILDNNNKITRARLLELFPYATTDQLLKSLSDDEYINYTAEPQHPYYVTAKGQMLIEAGGYVGKNKRENKMYRNSNFAIWLSILAIIISIIALFL